MYQGSRSVYCRYPGVRSKGVELVYDLTEKPLLFLDEGLVYPGMIVWAGHGGEPHPLHATVEFYKDTVLSKGDVAGHDFRVPFGVAFEAQPAQTGPTIEGWTENTTCTIRHEGGAYRCWMNRRLTPEARRALDLAPHPDDESRGYDLTSAAMATYYLESDDGVSWRAPELDVARPDGRPSNIVFGQMFVRGNSFSGMQVFRDPSAPPAERYKGVFTGQGMPARDLLAYCARHGVGLDPMSLQIALSRLSPAQVRERGLYDVVVGGRLPADIGALPPDVSTMAVYGATSPDGLRWQALDEPLLPFMCETSDVFYDAEKGRYVNYARYWQRGQRRNIGISETTDFRHWPQPRPLVCPGLNEALTTDYYTSGHSLYPGTTDVHFFFISKFAHGGDDCLDLWLAASLDGDVFEFVPGGPVVAAEHEDWAPDRALPAACVFPNAELVPFGPGHVGLVVRLDNVPHKWPRTKQWKHTYRWALWENERMVALHAPDHGQFTTAGLMLERPHLFVNVRTGAAGRLSAQLLDEQGQPVPGYGFEESDVRNGDHARAALTWSGQPVPAALVGRKIYLQFRLTRARLFSLSASHRP